MSEAMEQIESLQAEVDELTRNNEELEEHLAIVTNTKEAYCGCIERLSQILGLEGQDSCIPNMIEIRAKTVMSVINTLDEATLKRDKRILELRKKVEGRDEYVGRLENNLARVTNQLDAERKVVEMLKEKLDKGETFDDFERRVMELLEEGEPKRTLKRLATFMKYTLGLVRENRELGEKNITLDAENDHLAKIIDTMNATQLWMATENVDEPFDVRVHASEEDIAEGRVRADITLKEGEGEVDGE